MSEPNNNEQAVWEQIEALRASAAPFRMLTYIGLGMFVLGIINCFIEVLPVLPVSILLIVAGLALLIFFGIKVNRLNAQMNQLANEQLAPFVHETFLRTIGPYEMVTDDSERNAFAAKVRESNLIGGWDYYTSGEDMRGTYQGMAYETANLNIEEQTTQRDSDGHTSTSTDTVFAGVWIICKQAGSVSDLVTVKEKAIKLGSKEKYKIKAKNEIDAMKIPAAELIRQMDRIAELTGGKVSVAFLRDEVQFAISGAHRFYQINLADSKKIGSFDEMRAAITKEIEYEASVLQLLWELSFIARW